ncbi:MAG TPA: class I adenylate-forming enzyme family protein, partial [Phototrophicaceae bacterium]|nr:class I adenylate-forming enzyme family protein [Phototrophicaceae bacterium]
MLALSTRDQYRTLLDADTLTASDAAAPAIIYVSSTASPVTVSRRQFREQTRRYATALAQMNIRPGDLVIIAHTQNLESIYAFWGAMLLGAVPSMFPTLTEKLDPAIYMQNMSELVKFSGVRCILTTDDFAPTLAAKVPCPVYGSKTLLASLDKTKTQPIYNPNYTPAPDSVAFLQHSSGTTGLQKGVALSHRAVLNQ